MAESQFILASQSPRRADLLRRLGFSFDIQPADVDESVRPQESAYDYVARLAREKASAKLPSALPVLGADTVVVSGANILGKPQDEADAQRMLRMLSDGSHEVMTAVCIAHEDRVEQIVSTTQVDFAALSDAQIQAYWNSGEPCGKAGAYAIQGLAEAFVIGIRGSYSGVVGLPLQQSVSLLKLFDIKPPALMP